MLFYIQTHRGKYIPSQTRHTYKLIILYSYLLYQYYLYELISPRMKDPLIFENLWQGYIIYINRQTFFWWGFYQDLSRLHKFQANNTFQCCKNVTDLVCCKNVTLIFPSFAEILHNSQAKSLYSVAIMTHLPLPIMQLHVVFIRFSHNFVTIFPCLLFHHYQATVAKMSHKMLRFLMRNKPRTNYPKSLEYQYITLYVSKGIIYL